MTERHQFLMKARWRRARNFRVLWGREICYGDKWRENSRWRWWWTRECCFCRIRTGYLSGPQRTPTGKGVQWRWKVGGPICRDRMDRKRRSRTSDMWIFWRRRSGDHEGPTYRGRMARERQSRTGDEARCTMHWVRSASREVNGTIRVTCTSSGIIGKGELCGVGRASEWRLNCRIQSNTHCMDYSSSDIDAGWAKRNYLTQILKIGQRRLAQDILFLDRLLFLSLVPFLFLFLNIN